MSKSGPSLAVQVADDVQLHNESCPYYQYEKVHRKGLQSEDQMKERLTNRLICKMGALKGSTKDKAKSAAQEQVETLMSEGGIINQYMKRKKKVYDSYKPLMKSFCICGEAKIVTIDKQANLKDIKKANAQREAQLEKRCVFVLDENEKAPKLILAEDNLQEDNTIRDDSKMMGIIENHSDELMRQECADEKSPESPPILEIEQSSKPKFNESLLKYLKEVGLDLSEEDEDEENINSTSAPTPNDVDPVLGNGMKKFCQEEMEDEQKLKGDEEMHSGSVCAIKQPGISAKINYTDANPHDELDYDYDDIMD